MTASASSAVTLLSGSCAAIAAPWELSSPARELRLDIILAENKPMQGYGGSSKVWLELMEGAEVRLAQVYLQLAYG